jgi:alkaline phosphatase
MYVLRKVTMFGVLLTVGFTLMTSIAIAKSNNGPGPNKAKNIIFMVPDGQGLSNVTAARIFKNGPDGDPLYQETLEHIGYQRTHSKNSTVTDSAAAASAWASGEKYNNGEISCHDNDFDGVCDSTPVPTILDIAKSMGKATGLVATSDITHATPAAFGANVHNRKCEAEIALQFLYRDIDVLLGGGIAANRGTCLLTPSSGDWFSDLLDLYSLAGYNIVETESEMNTVIGDGAQKLLGLFKDGGKTPEMFRVDGSIYPDDEPTLPEMTAAALDILEEDKDGLFLMVEGSQIDWADHAHDVNYQIAESLAFDATVKVVLDWVNADADRKNHTLIIIVADHDCGGFAINGPYGTLSEAGEVVEPGWTSGDHTAVDTIIYSQGPGSERLNKAVDNTDLYNVMKDVIH